MSSYLNQIQTCIGQLRGKVLAERKNGCAQLKVLIDNEDIVNYLNQSANIWRLIFESLHHCLTKEYEKVPDKANKILHLNVTFASLISISLSKAMKARPKLNSSDIVSKLLGLLNMPICFEHIGEIILKCINSNILIYRQCCVDLKCKYFEELLHFSFENLKKKNTSKIDYELLRLMDLVLNNANEHPEIMDYLISIFYILEDLYTLDRFKNEDLQAAIIQLTLTFSKKLLNELNKVLMKFGENHIIDLYKYYIQITKIKKYDNIKISIFQILYIQLQLHHPSEIKDKYLEYFSYDISVWNKSLKYILRLLDLELTLYSPKESVPPILINLAIKTYKQAFERNLENIDEGNYSKRARYVDRFDFFLEKFEDVQSIQKHWLFLHVFELLISQHSEILKIKQILKVLNIMENLLNEIIDDPFISGIIFRLFSSLINSTKNKHIDEDISLNLTEIWNRIKDLSIRNLTIYDNTNIHILIQQLIKNKKIDDLENILNLFFKKSIKLTYISVITLDVLLNYGKWQNISLNQSNIILLFKWLFSVQETNDSPDHILCKMIGLIAIKLSSNCPYETFEKCFLDKASQDFSKSELYPELFSYYISQKKPIEISFSFEINALNKEILEYLFESLQNYNNALSIQEKNSCIKTLEYCLILSYVIQFLKMDKFNSIQDFLSIRILEFNLLLNNWCKTLIVPYIKTLLKELKNTNQDRSEHVHIILILFYHLLEIDLNLNGGLYKLIDNTFLQTLIGYSSNIILSNKKISTPGLYQVEGSETLNSHEDPDILLENTLLDNVGQSQILTIDIICKHICFIDDPEQLKKKKNFNKSLTISNKIIHHILSNIIPNELKIYGIYEFQMTYRYLKNIAKCGENLNDANTKELIRVFNLFFENFLEDQAAINVILNLLLDLNYHFKNNNHIKELRNKILLKLQKQFSPKASSRYGLSLKLKYIKCLGTLLKIDITSDYKEQILILLKDKYLQIRTSAVTYLPEILHYFHKEQIDLKNEIENNIEAFYISSEMNYTDASLSLTYHSYTVLHILAIMIMDQPQYLSFGLYHLARLFSKHAFSIVDFKIIFNMVIQNFKIDNTEFLFQQKFEIIFKIWLDKKNDLKKFPYQLLGVKSLEQFHKEYKLIIFPYIYLMEQNDYMDIILKNKSLIKETSVSLLGLLLLQCICHRDQMSVEKINFLIKEIGEDTMKELLDKINPQLLTYLIKNVVSREKFQQILEETKIQNSFDHLWPLESPEKFIFNLEKIHPFFKSVNIYNKNLIWKLHLELKLNIYENYFKFDKIKSICDYGIFIDYILSNFKNISKDILEDIILSLVHIINNSDEQIALFASHLIYFSYTKFLDYDADIIQLNLKKIINYLTIYARKENNLGNSLLKLIEYLVKSPQLKTSIKHLDDFPKEARFSTINTIIALSAKNTTMPLEKQIEHFNQSLISNISSEQRLDQIYIMLSLKEKEIKSIYKNLNHKLCNNFENYCVLHELFNKLIKQLCSSDLNIRMLSARCLGKLGIMDFEIYGNLPKHDITFENINNPFKTFLLNVYPLLREAIHDANPQIIKSASEIYYCINLDSSPNELKNTLKNIEMRSMINIEKFWSSDDSIFYNKWVENLTISLIEFFFKQSQFFEQLISLCSLRELFATQLLPYLMLLLSSVNQTFYERIGNSIELFLRKSLKLIAQESNDFTPDSGHIYLNHRALKLIITIIEYQRMYNYYKRDFIKMRNPFGIKQIYIAQAALTCKAFFTSLFYIEIWKKDNRDDDSMVNQFDLTENILKTCYNHLGNFDELYGFGDVYFTKYDNRIQHYSNIGLIHNAVEMSELKLRTSSNKTQANIGMLKSLKRAGHFETMYCYLQGLKSQGPFVEPMEKYEYECCWRMSQWNTKSAALLDSQQINHLTFSNSSFEKFHFFSLKGLVEKDKNLYSKAINYARQQIIDTVVDESLQDPLKLLQVLSRFQCLEELEEFNSAIQNSSLDRIMNIWTHPSNVSEGHFPHIEPIITQRSVILRNHLSSLDLSTHVIPSHMNFADIAFKASDYFTANSYIHFIKNLHPSNYEIIFKEALICWKQGDIVVSKALLNNIIQKFECSSTKTISQYIIFAKSLRLFGDILVKTKSENSQIIIDRFYQKSIEIFKNISTKNVTRELNSSYNSLASFANDQYQTIKSYLQTMEKMKKDVIEKSRNKASQLEREICRSPQHSRKADVIHNINLLRKQINNDEAQINSHYEEKNTFLELSIKYCLYSLSTLSSNNYNVFRLISNWIENKSLNSIKVHLMELLPIVPSYVFLTLIPQLCPHIGIHEPNEFREILHSLLKRCALDHPHHTLKTLIALAEPFKDDEYLTPGSRRNPTHQSQGSEILLNDISKANSKIQRILNEYHKLFSACIHFAYADNSPNIEILKLKQLSNIYIPTYDLQIDLTLEYGNVIGIRTFDKNFVTMTGINKPKKIICHLLDGSSTTLLIKGQDDLRQDAIMQQIFNIMNLLMNEGNTELKNRLHMRTYKVVPMSQRSGIIEWCNDTITLGSYLFDAPPKKGAHERYFPQDWNFMKCRKKIREAFQTTDQNRLKVFLEIYQNFHPVLSTFFFENFVDPKNWYNKRIAFTKSIAVSSMVGYIMGIGDRHCSNILIDLKTAEAIHIDFGFIFETGKFLKVPEQVPFRLTQNIVDALGLSGVKGSFTKLCEKSLQALKNNQEIISTIIEVLLYDPLYSWSIKPEKLSKIEDSSAVNTSAERVLIRLKEKLQGMEAGQFLTTTGQVRFLIQQASDPSLLSRMFDGWYAFA